VAVVDGAGTAVDLSEYIGTDVEDAGQTAIVDAATAAAEGDEDAAETTEAPAEDAKA
jgi:trigger factor